jgi:hypothetical protein
MAYMNQEKKAKIAAKLKPILKKFGLKGSLSVHNHSSIVLTIKSGSVDFFTDSGNPEDARKFGIQVNPYWYKDHFTGKAKEALSEIVPAMYSADYYDNSDAQTDYFDTAYYVHVNIGKWNKPYELTK